MGEEAALAGRRGLGGASGEREGEMEGRGRPAPGDSLGEEEEEEGEKGEKGEKAEGSTEQR